MSGSAGTWRPEPPAGGVRAAGGGADAVAGDRASRHACVPNRAQLRRRRRLPMCHLLLRGSPPGERGRLAFTNVVRDRANIWLSIAGTT
jgi:hypothetical protein